jgi:hypothetical protein
MDKETQWVCEQLQERWTHADLKNLLDISEADADVLVDTWLSQGIIEEPEPGTYGFTNQPGASEPVQRFPWLSAGIALACIPLLVFVGLVFAPHSRDAEPAVAALPTIPPPSATATAAPTATPDGLRLSSAVVACWNPGGGDCLALDSGTRYEAVARYASQVQIKINPHTTPALLWVDAADLAGIPAGLADLQPPPTPTTAPEPMIVYQQVPVYIESQQAPPPQPATPQPQPSPTARVIAEWPTPAGQDILYVHVYVPDVGGYCGVYRNGHAPENAQILAGPATLDAMPAAQCPTSHRAQPQTQPDRQAPAEESDVYTVEREDDYQWVFACDDPDTLEACGTYRVDQVPVGKRPISERTR